MRSPHFETLSHKIRYTSRRMIRIHAKIKSASPEYLSFGLFVLRCCMMAILPLTKHTIARTVNNVFIKPLLSWLSILYRISEEMTRKKSYVGRFLCGRRRLESNNILFWGVEIILRKVLRCKSILRLLLTVEIKDDKLNMYMKTSIHIEGNGVQFSCGLATVT